MRVLVIGSGGREHAICWKLSQSPALTELYCAPGNPGIAGLADLVPISVDDVHELADFAASVRIDLTVVGPELPLTLGLVDEFRRRGLAVFGPQRSAAELEGSKVFAKQFMERHGIPTARFAVAHDATEARRAVEDLGGPVVLKADGLAAGKGVVLPDGEDELERALAVFFEEQRFGSSGRRIVVEERLEGEEVSLISISDGKRLLPLVTSKDYKRIGEDDTGPNTGGMGSHCPSMVLDAAAAAELQRQLAEPTLAGMTAEGRDFSGFLYVGVMLTDEGPRVLEYNVRLGDPEAQAILMLLDDDLLPILQAGAAGDFGVESIDFGSDASACLVLANEGYPAKPITGDPIEGLEEAGAREGVEVFHAGTARDEAGRVLAASGRVLNVCARGDDLRSAVERAYEAAADIQWPHRVLRSDIGRRVLLY